MLLLPATRNGTAPGCGFSFTVIGEAKRCYCSGKARVARLAVRTCVRARLLGLCASGHAHDTVGV